MGQNSIDVKVDNTYSDSQILYHQGRHMLDPALVGTVTVQKVRVVLQPVLVKLMVQ